MKHPTYAEVASDFHLWQQYVDPHATMTEEEFDNMSFEELLAIEIECFGPEPEDDDEED